MRPLGIVFASIGGFAALLAVGFVMNTYGLVSYQFFAPKYRAAENVVFQQSQQYNEGMVRDLENIKRQYQTANPEQKQALRALTLHRFEVYPFDRLPPDLQNFYRSIQ